MGKLTDDVLKWTLDINGDPARKDLNKLEQSTRSLSETNKRLKTEMAKLDAQENKNTKEYRAMQKQVTANNKTIKINKTEMGKLRKEIGITGLTMKQLRSESKRLQNQLNNATPGTKEWKRLNNELTATKARMSELRGNGSKANRIFGDFKQSLKGILPAFGFAAILAGIGKMFKSLYELKKEIEGDTIRSTNVLGDSIGYVEEQAKKNAKQLGLTNREYVAATAVTADLLVPLGLARKKSAEMASGALGVAGALDEWTRGAFGLEEVQRSVNAALTGEMEGMKKFGIVIRQDSEEYKNLVKQKMEMEGVTKAQASAMTVLQLIQAKSLDAQRSYNSEGNKTLRMEKQIAAWWRRKKEQMVEAFQEKPWEKIDMERRSIIRQANALKNTNLPAERRNEIYDELSRLAPEIVEGLDKENINIGKLNENMREYNKLVLQKMVQARVQAEINEEQEKLLDIQEKVFESEMGMISIMDRKLETIKRRIETGTTASGQELTEDHIRMLQDYYDEVNVIVEDGSMKLNDKYTEYLSKTKEANENIRWGLTQSEIVGYDESAWNSYLEKIEKRDEIQNDINIKQDTYMNKYKSLFDGKNEEEENDTKVIGLLQQKQKELKKIKELRDAATSESDLINYNKEVEALENEIKRLNELGTIKPEPEDEETDTNYDTGWFEKEVKAQEEMEREAMEFLAKMYEMQLSDDDRAVIQAMQKYDKLLEENAKYIEYYEKQAAQGNKEAAETLQQYKDAEKQIIEQQNAEVNELLEKSDNFKSERKAARQKLDLMSDQEVYDLQLQQYQEYLNLKYISEEEYTKLVEQLDKELQEGKMESVREYIAAAGSLTNNLSSMIQGMQDAELMKVENKYAGELKAAGNNADKKSEIEEKIQKEQNAIRKKYANAQFMATIASMVADQAAGIVSIWAQFGNLPPVAGLLTAGLLAATIPQIAIAKQERNKTMQLKKGNVIDVIGKDDGNRYNADVIDDIRTGTYRRPGYALFNENPQRPELVVDGDTTARLKAEYPDVIQTIRYVSQHATGKYDAVDTAGSSNSKATAVNSGQDFGVLIAMYEETSSTLKRINEHLDKGLGINYDLLQQSESELETIKSMSIG
ncbi:MAG: hypothetical protein PF448_13120 [Bacteroidales bacterium]|jgi:hypothetical protein|nr:hypothetical protein [Bacteroidales bacterium]